RGMGRRQDGLGRQAPGTLTTRAGIRVCAVASPGAEALRTRCAVVHPPATWACPRAQVTGCTVCGKFAQPSHYRYPFIAESKAARGSLSRGRLLPRQRIDPILRIVYGKLRRDSSYRPELPGWVSAHADHAPANT